MKKHLILASFLLTTVIAFPTLSYADEKHDSHDKHDAKKSSHKQGHSKNKKAHHFSPHWAKTLSKKQKVDVDKMHLDLDRKLVILKAQETLKQKELNLETIKENAKQSNINEKIDDLMAIKNEILRHRYAHLIEMRNALTAEQRISYDMSILKRKKIK